MATEKQKCEWLGTWIGEEGREIYRTLQIPEDIKDIQQISQKFDEHVRPRKNKQIARHKLKNRRQASGETFMNFVKDLKIILMDCEYDNPDAVLEDCIIDGVVDSKLQEGTDG
ncbi:centrin-1 [Plakobranchus ocellatus]|uniref:Centrin-1 n=1 Tax=Plakobranchus ocellatus TaxID=259542 RepID=A0AAV4CMS1_9GAST|nr:centrin-1 [Plakobranchus ocellatus]